MIRAHVLVVWCLAMLVLSGCTISESQECDVNSQDEIIGTATAVDSDTDTSSANTDSADELVNGQPADVNAVADGLCVPYSPPPALDGGWSRVTFGPFKEHHTLNGIRFLAAKGPGQVIPYNWPFARISLKPGEDPAHFSCVPQAIGGTPKELGTWEGNGFTAGVFHDWGFLPADYAPGESIVVCFKQIGMVENKGLPTGLLMCGAAGSCDERDGFEHQIITPFVNFASDPSLCRHWAIELIEGQ